MNRSKKIVWVGFFLCASLWGAPFTDNGNGTVTDSATRLVWQKCSAGQGTTLGNCGTGSISWYTLSDALMFCEGLILGGRSDWRLPNINELKSIIDYTKNNPSIDLSVFPNTPEADVWWSSTTIAYNTSRMWIMQFNYGNLTFSSKEGQNKVRCVTGP